MTIELGDTLTITKELLPALNDLYSRVIGCQVKPYCKSAKVRGTCRKCHEYSKFERIKSESRQATGRRNKRKGKDSEKKLLLHLERQSLEARIIEGSGAYKKSRTDADSDLRVTILGKERKIENKNYASNKPKYAKIRSLIGENKILYIENFCYIMNENVFYDLLKDCHMEDNTVSCESGEVYKIKTVSDRNYGWLHVFFDQDYADIVSLDEAYHDFLLCVQPSLFKEIV